MSSARLGSDPNTSVADPTGELHDTPGVWIGDSSGMPTCSGANPMLTVMALAHRTATNMIKAGDRVGVPA
jgi:choline dehydrogenase-like flavoprotein